MYLRRAWWESSYGLFSAIILHSGFLRIEALTGIARRFSLELS